MALIRCPECGIDLSDKAAACPRCGYPIARGAARPGATHGVSALDLAKSVGARIVLGAVLVGSGVEYESGPVLIAAIAVLGSIVPVWLKARRAERVALPASADSRVIDERFREIEERFGEMEQNARQIAYLEERVEFAERVLASQVPDENDVPPLPRH